MEVAALLKKLHEERIKLHMLKKCVSNLENGVNVEDEIEKFDDHFDERQWKTRYEKQVETNRALHAEIEKLRKDVEEQKTKSLQLPGAGALDEFSGAEGRRLLVRMQREKTNLESQVRDYEWRLDQEATEFHKISEKRKALLQDMTRVQQKTAAAASTAQRRRSSVSSSGVSASAGDKPSPRSTATTENKGVTSHTRRSSAVRRRSTTNNMPAAQVRKGGEGGRGQGGTLSGASVKAATPDGAAQVVSESRARDGTQVSNRRPSTLQTISEN